MERGPVFRRDTPYYDWCVIEENVTDRRHKDCLTVDVAAWERYQGSHGDHVEIHLDLEDVEELHRALGEWMRRKKAWSKEG